MLPYLLTWLRSNNTSKIFLYFSTFYLSCFPRNKKYILKYKLHIIILVPQTLFFPFTSADLLTISWITSKIWTKSNKFHITFDQPDFPCKNKACQQSQKTFSELSNIAEERGIAGKIILQSKKPILFYLELTPNLYLISNLNS